MFHRSSEIHFKGKVLVPVEKSRVKQNLGAFQSARAEGPAFHTVGQIGFISSLGLRSSALNYESSQKSYPLQRGPSDYVIKDF